MKIKIFFLMLVGLLFVVVGSGLVSAGGIDEYTVLMLHMDGEDGGTTFTDDSDSSHTVYPQGDVHTNTVKKKFGTASAYFDGTGDYLTVPDSDDWNFGSGNFTIDFWINWYQTPNTYNGFMEYHTNADNRWQFKYQNGALVFATEQGRGNWIYMVSCDWTPSLNTWYHLAVTRSGNSFRIFIDGNETALNSVSVILQDYDALYIGRTHDAGQWRTPPAYIDELRISKGIARWTDNFDVPTSAYSSSPGNLTLSWISPSASTYVAQNEFWNFTLNLSCSSDGDCGFVNVTLDPWMINELKQGKSLQLDEDGNVIGRPSNTEITGNVIKETNKEPAEKNWLEKIVGFVKGIFRN